MDKRFTVHLPPAFAAVVHCPSWEVMKRVISGRIVPVVDFVYPLEQAGMLLPSR